MKTINKTALFLLICAAPLIISAQDAALKIPAEVKVFIEKDTSAIALESADLNGDGTKDFILITEKSKSEPKDDDADDKRTLIILTRDSQGNLSMAKRSSEVVYCRSCGGAFGDPFAGIEATVNSFTVNNYGGSAWRWSASYQFNYSRRDRTWQLVRVVEESFNALEPQKVKTKIYTPKKFGKIDLADFDPAAIR